MDVSVFYKNIQLEREKAQEDFLLKHGQIFLLIVEQILALEGASLINLGLDFVVFLVRNMYLLIDRTRYNEFINTLMGYSIAKLIIQLLIGIRNHHFLLCMKKDN